MWPAWNAFSQAVSTTPEVDDKSKMIFVSLRSLLRELLESDSRNIYSNSQTNGVATTQTLRQQNNTATALTENLQNKKNNNTVLLHSDSVMRLCDDTVSIPQLGVLLKRIWLDLYPDDCVIWNSKRQMNWLSQLLVLIDGSRDGLLSFYGAVYVYCLVFDEFLQNVLCCHREQREKDLSNVRRVREKDSKAKVSVGNNFQSGGSSSSTSARCGSSSENDSFPPQKALATVEDFCDQRNNIGESIPKPENSNLNFDETNNPFGFNLPIPLNKNSELQKLDNVLLQNGGNNNSGRDAYYTAGEGVGEDKTPEDHGSQLSPSCPVRSAGDDELIGASAFVPGTKLVISAGSTPTDETETVTNQKSHQKSPTAKNEAEAPITNEAEKTIVSIGTHLLSIQDFLEENKDTIAMVKADVEFPTRKSELATFNQRNQRTNSNTSRTFSRSESVASATSYTIDIPVAASKALGVWPERRIKGQTAAVVGGIMLFPGAMSIAAMGFGGMMLYKWGQKKLNGEDDDDEEDFEGISSVPANPFSSSSGGQTSNNSGGRKTPVSGKSPKKQKRY